MRTIQMVRAREIWPKINHCVDQWVHQSRPALMREKLGECSPNFIDSIRNHGVMLPIVVMVTHPDSHKKAYWEMGNGHHRFAVALEYDLEVPVVFVDGYDAGDWMHKDLTQDRSLGSYYSRV